MTAPAPDPQPVIATEARSALAAFDPRTDAATSVHSVVPTSSRERFGFLDVLRGVAILGILPENIPLMGLPMTLPPDQLHAVTSSGWREPVAYYLTRFFGDYKFLSIFSLLFGIGLALIFDRCVQAGRSFRRLYARRLLVLGCIGVGHACLIWAGDILAFYALLGLIVMWAAGWAQRTLLRVGTALLAVPAVVMLGVAALAPWRASLPEVVCQTFYEAPPAADWREPLDAFIHLPIEQRFDHIAAWERHILRDGGFAEGVVLRAALWALGLAVMIPYIGCRVAGLFLIGMAWMRDGWVARPAENMDRFRRLAWYGLLVGGPLQTGAVVVPLVWPQVPGVDALAEALQYTGSLGLSAIYVYIVARLFVAAPASGATRALAATGRCALSNYILESVFCTAVFYSHGLAWLGRFDRMQLWGVVLACWVANLIFSVSWMRGFQFGPLEWLWRRLTYGRVMAVPKAVHREAVREL